MDYNHLNIPQGGGPAHPPPVPSYHQYLPNGANTGMMPNEMDAMASMQNTIGPYGVPYVNHAAAAANSSSGNGQTKKKLRKSSSSTVESGWEEVEPAREPAESKLGWSKFTRNLFEMASNAENGAAIGFNAEGDCLEIRNHRLLGSDILPKYYKHKNVSSFVRQLNNYGFKTTPTPNNSETIQCFYHENFKRGRLDLLGAVTRRGASKGEKDVKTMQLEIDSLRRREAEQRNRAKELEERNRQLIMENNELVEENKRLKVNWNSMRESMGRSKSQGSGSNQGYHQDPAMYAAYPADHQTMFRSVLPLFNPVTQTMSSVDPSNPNSLMQHVIVDEDFHRSGGPFGNMDA
jgi:hypothetical protein